MQYYMYGITSSENPLRGAHLAPIEKVAGAHLAAMVEPVSDADFSPQMLDARLSSLEWVARTARRHQSVLGAAMESGPVIPARLCTLFSNRDAILHYLSENEERLSTSLRRLKSCSEWGLKIFCDEGQLGAAVTESDAEIQSLAATAVSASPGRAYVLYKKRDARRDFLRRERIDAAMDQVLEELGLLPISICHKTFLSKEMTGRNEPMVLNVAALVGDAELTAYHATVKVLSDELGAEGFLFETSGPWPAYSFSGDEEQEMFGDDETMSDRCPRFAKTGS